jgi:hypothetical protein
MDNVGNGIRRKDEQEGREMRAEGRIGKDESESALSAKSAVQTSVRDPDAGRCRRRVR